MNYSQQISFPATESVKIVWCHNSEYDCVNSKSTEQHMHPCYELYVYIAGNISFVVKDHIFTLERGDMIFTSPNTYHHSICHKDCLHEHFCFFIYTDDPYLTAIFDRLSEHTLLRYEEEHLEQILELLYRTEKQKLAGEGDRILEQRAHFYHLVSLLQENTEPIHIYNYPDKLQEILSYIENHYAEIESVKELCMKFYISQSTLMRLFRQYLNISPFRHLESVKLAGACRSLCKNCNVTQAAMENGFGDVSHFISLFRKRFGVTPNRYRQSMSNKDPYTQCSQTTARNLK